MVFILRNFVRFAKDADKKVRCPVGRRQTEPYFNVTRELVILIIREFINLCLLQEWKRESGQTLVSEISAQYSMIHIDNLVKRENS